MKYLTAQEILILNARVVDAIGGAKGVRDVTLLKSIEVRPQTTFEGKEMYADVFSKAAVYLESIATYHVFVDGNKRTALMASARFLYVNGYTLNASNADAEAFVLQVATEKLTIESIAKWFKQNTRTRKGM